MSSKQTKDGEKKRKNLETSIEEKLAKKAKMEMSIEQKLKEKEKKLKEKSMEQKLKEMEEKLKAKEEKQQKKIEEKLSKLPSVPTVGNMTMDEEGNLIDNEGNVLRSSRKKTVSSLINLKKQQEDTSNQLKIEAPKSLDKTNPYVDPNVKNPSFFRRNRSLHFNEQGKFIEQADKLRNFKAKMEYKNQQIGNEEISTDQESGKIKISGDVMEIEKEQEIFKKKTIGEIQLEIGIEEIPNVEWWDALILPKNFKNFETDKIQISEKKVNQCLIEHPIPIKSADPDLDLGPLPMILTPKERKKLKNINKLEREKEKQKKIQLGLIPAPPPKANLKNFMKVHLNEGTMDPTQLEQKIRAQIAKRVENHENRNQERKLTQEQKFEKNKQKAADEASKGIEVTFLKVDEITHPGIKFKINQQAQEKFISGCVLVLKNFCLIIGEGGSKYIRKFQDVMLNKTKWNRELEPTRKQQNDEEFDNVIESLKSEKKFENSMEIEPTENQKLSIEKKEIKCELLWNGIQRKRNFKGFKFIPFDDEESVKTYLKDHGVLHLWEFAMTQAE
eukprot:gene260-6675_t